VNVNFYCTDSSFVCYLTYVCRAHVSFFNTLFGWGEKEERCWWERSWREIIKMRAPLIFCFFTHMRRNTEEARFAILFPILPLFLSYLFMLFFFSHLVALVLPYWTTAMFCFSFCCYFLFMFSGWTCAENSFLGGLFINCDCKIQV